MDEGIVMNVLLFFMCFRASYTMENSISLSQSHDNGFLMLQCQVKNNECCRKAKEIEFKKNGDGVCDLRECTGAFAIPLTRDDTKYYRCFCPGYDFHRAHLLITETRLSDYGSWICECTDSDTDKVCMSNVLVVSETSIKEDINVNDSKISVALLVSIVLAFIGGAFGFISSVVQWYISWRMNKIRRYTEQCLGISQDEQYAASSHLLFSSGRFSSNVSYGPEWCICSECEETNQQCLCCGWKKCITLHKDFETYCFNDIDETPLSDSEKQREKRIRAYKNYSNWNSGIIAVEQGFVILPACCEKKIQDKFPDPESQYFGIEKESVFQEIPILSKV